MSYALEVDHVGKAYDNFKLEDISFRLEEGLIMGLIGTNGAGKTTLIQILLGLLQKTGHIKIYGYDTEDAVKKTKDLCGFVLDENPFLTQVNALGNARIFGPYYSGWDMEKFKHYCSKFEVNLRKPLHKLSQGTITKFQLAFALSHDAKLLVFDEPSSGLDPIFRRELLDIMYDIIMEGERSIIFSTHLTHDLDNVADYILMLHEGKQLFSMSKDELIDGHRLVRGSAEEINRIPLEHVIAKKHAKTYSEALIHGDSLENSSGLSIMRPTIEDIMFYMVARENERVEKEVKDNDKKADVANHVAQSSL